MKFYTVYVAIELSEYLKATGDPLEIIEEVFDDWRGCSCCQGDTKYNLYTQYK